MKPDPIKYRIIILVLAAISLALAIAAWKTSRYPGDLAVSLFIQSLNSATLHSVMFWTSEVFGGIWITLVTLGIALVIWKTMGGLEAAFIVLSAVTSIVNYLFKYLVGRPRPSADLVQIMVTESDKSFPSGHAVVATLLLGMLAFLLYTHLQRPYLKLLSLSLSIAFILLVGLSRIFLGVHWLSDVLGGYLVGATLLTALIYLYQVLKAGLAKQ
jgi:undecaprenyl-diphosphatase